MGDRRLMARTGFLCLSFLLLSQLLLPASHITPAAAQAPATEVFIDPSISPDTANAIRKTISATLEYAQTNLGRTRTRTFRASSCLTVRLFIRSGPKSTTPP